MILSENGHYNLSMRRCLTLSLSLSFWKASSLYMRRGMNVFRSCCQSVPSASFGNKVSEQSTLTDSSYNDTHRFVNSMKADE